MTTDNVVFGDETDADREQARQSATSGRKKQQAHQVRRLSGSRVRANMSSKPAVSGDLTDGI
jgi:hypothetical protein